MPNTFFQEFDFMWLKVAILWRYGALGLILALGFWFATRSASSVGASPNITIPIVGLLLANHLYEQFLSSEGRRALRSSRILVNAVLGFVVLVGITRG